MINISFANPYLLLLAIPLALLIVIPYVIAIRKDNCNGHVIGSLVLHFVMVLCITAAVAGTEITTVLTETNVYVVADVSYSSSENMDKIDDYIQKVKEELPSNSKMGVVCFGRDYVLHTELGGRITSVKEAAVDDSATDITSALDYTATLFRPDVLKRIVLITDGKQTDSQGEGNLIRAIENLYAADIDIDAMYLDNNLAEDAREVQISEVDYTKSTFLNHEATADVLVQSARETNAIVSLFRGDEKVTDKAVVLNRGYNIVNFTLDTSVSDTFLYEVRVSSEDDTSPHNNAYAFTQKVTGNVKVLLVSSLASDLEAARRLFGDRATIDSYINDPYVPCTVEELCQYDEIVLANVDVRKLENYISFIASVEKVVSQFGKSLVTVGDLQIQNKTDEVLRDLENMLPVKFGNDDADPKLLTIVMDVSLSMYSASHMTMAKQAAIQMMHLLGDEDYIAIVAFYGEIQVVQNPIAVAGKKDELTDTINALTPHQGTFLGAGLQTAFNLIGNNTMFRERQVMLISDGMSYTTEKDDPVSVVNNMTKRGIVTSVLNTGSADGAKTLQNLAKVGRGHYYYATTPEDIYDLVLDEVADELTESIVTDPSEVNVDLRYDNVVKDVTALPFIKQYVYAKTKASAITVLTANYKKSEGDPIKAPIYAYWDYGNGRVSTLTVGWGDDWTSGWEADENGSRFYDNMFTSNTPKERIDYPYNLDIQYDGLYTTVEIIPGVLQPDAVVTVTVTLPSGETVSEQLTFDSARYFYRFATPFTGKYDVHIDYSYSVLTFATDTFFTVAYSPEYDRFVTFDAAALHRVIRNRGTVTETGDIDLSPNEEELTTYTVNLIAPLMIATVVLYLADIVIRKLKWADIRSLFSKTKTNKKGEKA